MKGGKHRPAPPDDSVSMEDLLLLVRLRQQLLTGKEN